MEIDSPQVKAEVEQAFARYEAAIVSNDIAVLDSLFNADERTIRYGIGENLYGIAAIRAFRAARQSGDLARSLSRTIVSTYGKDLAVASTLFQRDSMGSKIGRQTQTWVRFPNGWKIVAAHVSVIAEDASHSQR